MSIADDAEAIRAASDFTMAQAAVEQIKNELFENEGQCAQVLAGHPAMADISGRSARAKELAEQLGAAIHVLAGTMNGVADTLLRGEN